MRDSGCSQVSRCRLGVVVRAIDRTARAVIAVACIATPGCERRSGGNPWVIAGPTVPGVVLREPFVWDTREELMAWTDNAVTRGAFRIDTDGSNARSPSSSLLEITCCSVAPTLTLR